VAQPTKVGAEALPATRRDVGQAAVLTAARPDGLRADRFLEPRRFPLRPAGIAQSPSVLPKLDGFPTADASEAHVARVRNETEERGRKNASGARGALGVAQKNGPLLALSAGLRPTSAPRLATSRQVRCPRGKLRAVDAALRDRLKREVDAAVRARVVSEAAPHCLGCGRLLSEQRDETTIGCNHCSGRVARRRRS
jgi:hypothetical protein